MCNFDVIAHDRVKGKRAGSCHSLCGISIAIFQPPLKWIRFQILSFVLCALVRALVSLVPMWRSGIVSKPLCCLRLQRRALPLALWAHSMPAFVAHPVAPVPSSSVGICPCFPPEGASPTMMSCGEAPNKFMKGIVATLVRCPAKDDDARLQNPTFTPPASATRAPSSAQSGGWRWRLRSSCMRVGVVEDEHLTRSS
jgi:hypothetical protein